MLQIDRALTLARMSAIQARLLFDEGRKADAVQLAARALAMVWLAGEAPRLRPIRVRVTQR